jgi:hypothetical protein
VRTPLTSLRLAQGEPGRRGPHRWQWCGRLSDGVTVRPEHATPQRLAALAATPSKSLRAALAATPSKSLSAALATVLKQPAPFAGHPPGA